MRQSVKMLTIAAAVGMGTILGGHPLKTNAESVPSLKEKQSNIQEQRSGVNSNINDAQGQINELQNQQANAKSEMQQIDLAIATTTKEIEAKTAKLNETKAEIAKLQDEIKVIADRIEKRNLLLKDRIRSYQETGGVVNYLDVLMGATSFSDFVDRANAVATIMQADQEILKQQETDKQALQDKENQVEKDLANIEKMVADLQKMNQQLSAQRAEKDKLLAQLAQQEGEVKEYMMDLQEQEQILAAQENAIQKAIQLEQERQAAAAKAAAEAAAAAKAAAASSGGSSVSAAPAPAVSSGSFTRPAAGSITSTYGVRGGTMHWGVDIAQAGTVPVVAAADGVVYVSHYSSSYGNVVYILHNINGQMYTTVYAHMRSAGVPEGTVVKKGQQIGIMGNTGDSRGQHLHFELYRGKWAFHTAINPMGIVPL
ncbi:murein hydrolase activator EnvC family protein [Neobacillus dielmonensis]|uniref:murein hydrolase activator EnvC family protein n=1 Tax=Neobacillus dielmonensis TaxID=1347369 RepID=UPI0005A888B0|nr:M23 family metallopeptidase [Neobacillus dielmonensis]